MDSNANTESAATTGIRERGACVFVGSAGGKSVGETGVVWVIVGSVATNV
jgi:hypothetical protein